MLLPGQYYDAETNTHYNYSRDYDPSIGRWHRTSLSQFTCWTQHTGEVAYRSLYPCLPQVVANITA